MDNFEQENILQAQVLVNYSSGFEHGAYIVWRCNITPHTHTHTHSHTQKK